MAKGALLPENAIGGAVIPDGEYDIEAVAATTFNYGGRQADTPAILVVYKAVSDKMVYEQHYTAGKESALHESMDSKRFETISKNSNAWLWLGSIMGAGFPKERVDDDVTVFSGSRVTVVNQAQPKRPGIKDQVEGKTIPLITKVLALPGEKKAGARPLAAQKSATTAAKTAAPTATASPSNGGAALDAVAIELAQTILAQAGGSLTKLKLSTQAMLRLAKDPNMMPVKQLLGDSAWLAANAETGGWSFDGNIVTLGGGQ